MTSEPDPKIPKDLKVVMGTKLERFWTGVRDAAKSQLENAESTAILQKAVLLMAEIKIKEEQRHKK